MSRFCGEVNPTPILDAADYWRGKALLEGRSVFTDEHLWSNAFLEELDRYYVQRLDVGEGNFLEKLKEQLAPASPGAIQLAAEMMWLLYLCPSKITPAKKQQTLQTIWSWSGVVFPADSPRLNKAVLSGIGSAGPGFNQNQWRELVFVIGLVRAFRQLPHDAQTQLLSHPWDFDKWVSALPDADSRQFRHMILFLLFPDTFERIFGQTDRRAVAVAFSRIGSREVARLGNVEMDQLLFGLRQGMESKYGRKEIDFYVSPVRDEWKTESLTELGASIDATHVLAALKRIDLEGVPGNARSTQYDLVHEGRRYPPKYVLSLAIKESTGEVLDRATFTGGEESVCFKILRDRGFEIVPKEVAPADFVRELERFIRQATEAADLATTGYSRDYRGLRVKVSFGQGNASNVPWIAWLGGEERVSQGIYPVLLFFKAEAKLILCYGVSETHTPSRLWPVNNRVLTVREWFKTHLQREPYRYGESFVAAAYDVSSLDYRALQAKLDEVIDTYIGALQEEDAEADHPLSTEPEDDLPVRADLESAAEAFADALLDAGVSFGERHSKTVSSFLASLTTKPLVILTGLSGSGKSQIAVRLGEWIGVERMLVAPVRPDWTGTDALFGYEDALKPSVEGLPAWNVPRTLSFMLEASRDPQHPYLLVLDEMNLAHVERYFADVLSGMESNQPCIPDLREGSDGFLRPFTRDARIAVPRNLWIVGTVNVDETTYMFSPKVLDRANTLEFRVRTSDLTVSPKKPGQCAPAEKDLIRGLQQIAADHDWHVSNPFSQQAELVKCLHAMHGILSQFGLEFGHRVFYEAVRFAAMVERSGISGVNAVLDLLLLQKILPRLHGSRRRMEAPLVSLRAFCRSPSYEHPAPPVTLSSDSGAVDPEAVLPESSEKLGRMLRSLRANQFVSFSE